MITLIDAVVDDILLKRNLVNITPEKREWYTKRLRKLLEQRFHITIMDSLSEAEWKEAGIDEGKPLSAEFLEKIMKDPVRIELINAAIAEFIEEYGQPPIMELDEDLAYRTLHS